MSIRALDKNWDFTFGQSMSNYLNGNEEIAQNVKSRILSWLGDCFWDTEAGIDWNYLLGNKGTEQQIILAVRGMIIQTQGVVRITSFDFSTNNRKLTFSSYIDTIYSKDYKLEVQV